VELYKARRRYRSIHRRDDSYIVSQRAHDDLFGERRQGEIRRIYQLDTPVNKVPVLILRPIGIRRTPWLCSNYGGFALTVGLQTPAATRLYGYGYKPDTRVG
jgi:hypothetical protein